MLRGEIICCGGDDFCLGVLLFIAGLIGLALLVYLFYILFRGDKQ